MKQRLDSALVERGLAPGRDRAKGLIQAGQVYLNGQKADKVGQPVGEGDLLELRGEGLPFVSRGGLKLEKALSVFGIDLAGAVCADLGASTGGFTDCMLQRGARRVYAVDVGYGQLAWALRQDSRVKVMERTNARQLTPQAVGEPLRFVSMDLSFISLTLVLPAAYALLGDRGEAVCLIKPQFEAGRDRVGKNGVVRDRGDHAAVIDKIVAFSRGMGFVPVGLSFSPVKGPKGNIEYLLYLRKGADSGDGAGQADLDIAAVVADAHNSL